MSQIGAVNLGKRRVFVLKGPANRMHPLKSAHKELIPLGLPLAFLRETPDLAILYGHLAVGPTKTQESFLYYA